MGRFLALVSVLVACGDNLTVEDVQDPDFDGPAKPGIEARYVPAVCGVRTWDASFAADVSVSVAPGTEGASMVALSSGTLYGFVIDPRMDIASSTKIDLGATYSSVTASFVGGRVATTSIDTSTVYVHQLDDALANPQYITSLPGTHLAKPAFYAVGNEFVMPVVTDEGLWLHRFYDSLEPIDFARVMPVAKPPRALSATEMAGKLLTAFSTDGDCYLALTDATGAGPTKQIASACENPRLAAHGDLGIMLFDSVDGVRLMRLDGAQFGGDALVVRSPTHTPRIVFDGTRFWVSYIDVRGQVVVGFLDENLHPNTLALPDPSPATDGYELVMIDGAPWVITLTTNGYAAHQMCAVPDGSSTLPQDGVRGHSMDQLTL